MQKGAIWIIDDDHEDQDIIIEICNELKLSNELVFLNSAEAALSRLEEAKIAPFIIICDVNLPRINGFELREILLAKRGPKFHSVPFIYWSTQASESQIKQAYDLSAHGFFIKDSNFGEWKSTFIRIVDYWTRSRMPSKV
jgi:CheY-like chemotaxis protein